MSAPDPSKPSGAHDRMSSGWRMIDDILAGPEAIRNAGQTYLPKYAGEAQAEYDRRRQCAPWSAEFEDILRGLTAKPFAKPVGLRDGASASVLAFAEDVDTRGRGLTAFAREVFDAGVAKGVHGIFVDYSATTPAVTVAQQQARRERPYWVSVRAEDILALDTAFIDGREAVIHLRLRENSTVREDYEERTVERVREYNRAPIYTGDVVTGYAAPTWQVWEARSAQQGQVKAWDVVQRGTMSLSVIPLVLFWTGKREGSQFVRPPLLSVADKQIELYRALARQDETMTYAGSPMLAAKGMQPPKGSEPVEVGPKRILYAPEGGSWDYIQPDAENLRQIREHVTGVIDDIRRLGMQPLTQRSGAVTATASAIEGARAHSAVQSWALALRDALDAALALNSAWVKEQPTGGTVVHTDFLPAVADQVPLDALAKARTAGDISRVAHVEALKRFGVLSPDFDVAADEEQIAEEMAGLHPEDHEGLRLVREDAA